MALIGSSGLGAYAGAVETKQSDGRAILSRLSRMASELQNASDLASGVATKLLGPRAEALNAREASDPTPARPDFLTDLRNICSQLEAAHGNIVAHLNRVDQSF